MSPTIIDARHRLAWHRRLLSDLSTLAMWGGWLWLWAPVLRSSAAVAGLTARANPLVAKMIASGSVDAMERSVVAAAGASGALLVWSRLAAKTSRPAAPLSLRECARHFGVPEDELHASRASSICVVQHDESGRIVRVQRRTPQRYDPPDVAIAS